MRLGDILSGCEYEIVRSNDPHHPPLTKGGQGGGLDTEISGIAYDSRKVVEDTLFIAVRGESLDGHDFIQDAIQKGAAVVVGETLIELENLRIGELEKSSPDTRVSKSPLSSPLYIRVNDSRRALACISNNFYKRPSEYIAVIGVTGTNGKTTTSHIIKSILEAWKRKVGLIGTITYNVGNKNYPALYTTPESLEFQALLSEMVSSGCSHVVTEVSSHSLAQKRVDHTRFVIVVFTNLTRDHLDFHGTMEEYYSAKKRLFTELISGEGTAVINLDDEWGRRLKEDLNKGSKRQSPRATRRGEDRGRERPSIITYGIEGEADIMAVDVEDSLSGSSFTLKCRDKSCRLTSPLLGIPNVYNILAAASVGVALNVPIDVIQEGVKNTRNIKGRFETVDAGQDFLCIIDYAHTPDALERLIYTARELLIMGQGTRGKEQVFGNKIITVFGCGGDRDRGKRPVMGEIATRLSDYAIITSDNPRSEEPVEIINEIVSGVSKGNYLVVPDRRDAITIAVKKAGASDIILIAGKGHEDYQEICGVRHRFSDREVAEEAIRKKMERGYGNSDN